MILLHLGALHLADAKEVNTPWHRLTPRSRVLCSVLLVFAIALTPNGRWLTWAVYGTAIAALMLLSRVKLTILFKRVAIEFIFISVVIIGTLFHDGNQVVLQWGWVRITTEGLIILGSVASKSFLSLLLLNVLVLTTSIPSLLHALISLKMPPLLVAILASMYRYIAVLVDEFTSMQRAARSRNLMSHPKRQRTIIGNMIGSLFIRTYDRGERVHQAMLARGYQGLPPMAEVQTPGPRDKVAISFTGVVALIGQAIYLGH
jgi:cobalt/nickel transport system permease protein